MNLRDPRLAQTVYLFMVAFFSLWIGHFSAQDGHSSLSWVVCVLYAVAGAGFLFLLLHHIWKPNAARP
jgi:hypothetical protein